MTYRLSEMTGEKYARWESTYLSHRETEPRCDVCAAHFEETDWCAGCGCCVQHCQVFTDCATTERGMQDAITD